MISYNDIADKQDRLFLHNAKRILGNHRFNELIPEVKEAFKAAYDNEPNENKKPNVAKRAANMIYSKAMKDKR